MFSTQVTVLVAISLWCVLSCVYCQDSAMDDFFMKASKSIPRIGRSNSKSSKGSNDDFENFFLKASKSVPRIGRRDQVSYCKLHLFLYIFLHLRCNFDSVTLSERKFRKKLPKCPQFKTF